MAKRKKNPPSQEEQASPGKSEAEASPSRFQAWIRHNRSDLRFLLIFTSCLVVYYLATLTTPIRDGFFPAYLRWNASVSGVILNTIGQEVTVEKKSIRKIGGASIQVERGCDAVAPSALFVSAVLASPVALGSRIAAALIGSFALMVLNLVRVCSLFLIRVYYPTAFEVMHLDVWQALFILMALLFWALWASGASKKHRLAHATT